MMRKNARGDLPVIHPDTFIDPAAILRRHFSVGATAFSDDVARTNNGLVRGDETIQNEF